MKEKLTVTKILHLQLLLVNISMYLLKLLSTLEKILIKEDIKLLLMTTHCVTFF